MLGLVRYMCDITLCAMTSRLCGFLVLSVFQAAGRGIVFEVCYAPWLQGMVQFHQILANVSNISQLLKGTVRANLTTTQQTLSPS